MRRFEAILAAGLAVTAAVAILAACARHPAPPGRWEGIYDQGGAMIAARLEIETDGTVRVSAPDLLDLPPELAPGDRAQMRAELAARLAQNWDAVAPQKMDFDGRIFRKPGGIAPYIVWDRKANGMTLILYPGTRPEIHVPLRPVRDFGEP